MTADPKSLTREALEAFQRGAGPAALSITTRIIDAGKDAADAYGIRGMIMAQRKEWPRALSDLTAALSGGSDLNDVADCFAECAAKLGGLAAAGANLAKYMKQWPENVALRLTYARICGTLQGPAEELAVLVEGLCRAPDNIDMLQAVGAALLESGNVDQAILVAERFSALAPDNPEAAHMCGTAYLQAGQMDKAATAYLDAMARQPAYPRSMMAFSRLKHDALPPEQVAEVLRSAQAQVKHANDEDAVHLYYGIGHMLETQGQYPEAFQAYQRGGATRARQLPYDRSATEKRARAIKAAFPARVFSHAKASGNPTRAPIFVLGLPRSGSTLVEQILSCHSQVEGLGELPLFPNLAGPQVSALAPGGAIDMDWAKLAETYLDAVARLRTAEVPHFVDKTLINSSLIGALHLAFPNAKIIHTKRYILDTCASCFSLRFYAGHEWSYRLSDMAHFVSLHDDLMAHWNTVLPGRLIEVDYDDLVSRFEPNVKRLIAACDLEWEEACLEPHKNRRAVSTSSNAQVREPVNRGSQGRWRRFETQLAPLRRALGI